MTAGFAASGVTLGVRCVGGGSLISGRGVARHAARTQRTLVRMADDHHHHSTPPPPSLLEEPQTPVQKFVTTTETKIDEVKDSIGKFVAEFDPAEASEDIKDGSQTLFGNFLAGEWLTRGEVFGAVQVVFAFALLQDSRFLDDLSSFAFGPLALFSGMAISAKSAMDLGVTNLSLWPRPVPEGTLKTEGLYSVVRHPVYAGLLLASLGWSGATHSPARFALTVALAVFLDKKLEVEEQYLEDQYTEYAKYKEEVPFKIVPKIY